jgi:phytoene dehydrogenase-like protein
MYDTIVIGNDFSSLIAALVAAHSGKRTALLSEGHIPDFHTESGYTFNIDPFPWTGSNPGGLLRRLLSEIDTNLVDQLRIQPLYPDFQVILPEHRVDLYSKIELLSHELKREFAIDSEKTINFYESIIQKRKVITSLIQETPYVHPGTFQDYLDYIFHVPVFLWNRKGLSSNLKSVENNPLLKRIFDAEILLLSNLCPDGTAPLSSAYILSFLLNGFYYYSGGKHHLIEELKKKFTELGGIIFGECSILRLNIKEEIKADILVDKEAFVINSSNVIISTKWEQFKEVIIKDKRFSKLANKYTHVEKLYFPFTVHMGLCDKGLPEQMAEYVMIISDGNESLADGNLVFLETSLREDTGRAPSGKRAMSATILLNESPLSLSNEDLKAISKNILIKIEDFLPFFTESFEFMNIDSSINISRKYQEVINQKYTTRKNSILGISPLSNKTPVENVFLTGGMLFAGLGFDGEVISGLNAANMIIGDN